MSLSSHTLIGLLAALVATPLAAQTCADVGSGAYHRGDCQPVSIPVAPTVPLTAAAPLQSTTTGYALELQPDALAPRRYHSFDVADFYGSLQLIGGTPGALFAYDTAIDGQVWYIRDNADWGTLREDGSMDWLGPMQSDHDYDYLEDMAIDPRTGAVYVATIKNTADDAISKLYSLDLATGVMSPIGEMGSGWMVSIAINCQGELYSEDVRDQTLYRVDPQTAARTPLGPTGIAAQTEQGLSFDRADGTLYSVAYFGAGVSAWGRFDTTTGAFTRIADPSPDAYPARYLMKLKGACPASVDTVFQDGFDG